MNRIWYAFLWQLRAIFYEQRTALGFFVVLNTALWLLPYSLCQMIDKKAGILVIIISICYGFSLLMAFLYNMNRIRENPGIRQNELWYLAEPNPWIRIFSRLAAGCLATAVWFLNGHAGTVLMRKFAGDSHSYFRMELNHNIPGAYLQFAVFLPLLYLFLCLISGRKQERKGRVLMIFSALIIGEIFLEIFQRLSRVEGIAAILFLSVILFWVDGKMAGKKDIL